VEKLQQPQQYLDTLAKTSIRGYIQGASPIWEAIRHGKNSCKGHILNRWVLWVDNNVLHLLPKYTYFEYLTFTEQFQDEMTRLLQVYPHYRSMYYTWSPSKPLRYIVYEHGVNFDVQKDYPRLLTMAIEGTMKSANEFLNHINMKSNIFKDNDPIPESLEA
jgi:hypothetical protein